MFINTFFERYYFFAIALKYFYEHLLDLVFCILETKTFFEFAANIVFAIQINNYKSIIKFGLSNNC